jgi:hypothetical protein
LGMRFSNYRGYRGYRNRAPSECSSRAASARPMMMAREISAIVVFMVWLSRVTGYRWPGFRLARGSANEFRVTLATDVSGDARQFDFAFVGAC